MGRKGILVGRGGQASQPEVHHPSAATGLVAVVPKPLPPCGAGHASVAADDVATKNKFRPALNAPCTSMVGSTLALRARTTLSPMPTKTE